ncbi:MAG: fructosamine kinase family protein [Gammaproteobacteria bacterium]|nr:fructosamine kinase family protein [Gammaproteobacteria bacterium]
MSTSHSAIESLIHDTGVRGPCAWRSLGHGVGGTTWRVTCGDSAWFVKTQKDALDIFTAEADGLKALMDCGAVRVPRVLGCGEQETDAFLVMEWLELGQIKDVSASLLGSGLARQHRCTGQHFGWWRSNFIGATPQFNAPSENWVSFLRDHRLQFQLQLAAENGFRGSLQTAGARLLEKLPVFFEGYTPAPSLLHGDLWGGNWGVLKNGVPVIFDASVYYGDREADVAMTQLFGGFPPEFYAAYEHEWPLDAGYALRRMLYQLYHVLNHLNLFGSGYLGGAERMIGQLLSETHA